MGGYGSGRTGGKATTDTMKPLDVRRVARDGLLRPGARFAWQWSVGGRETASINAEAGDDRVTLDYRTRDQRGEWVPRRYDVLIERTPCTYGGNRPWWLCPCCGRRCAVLYGGSVFACRQCHRLTYSSSRETDDDRAIRAAEKIRRRLGWGPGILNPEWRKPKGMHWRTFNKLLELHEQQLQRSLVGITERLDAIRGNVERLRL